MGAKPHRDSEEGSRKGREKSTLGIGIVCEDTESGNWWSPTSLMHRVLDPEITQHLF